MRMNGNLAVDMARTLVVILYGDVSATESVASSALFVGQNGERLCATNNHPNHFSGLFNEQGAIT